MTTCATLIIDGFYDDPNTIRERALSLNYSPKENAKYPGGESQLTGYDWEKTRQDIISMMHMSSVEHIIPGKNFHQGKFRLATANDEANRPDGVHQDLQKYSAIVYLSKDEHCKGGVGLYKCRISGEVAMTPTWVRKMSQHFGCSPASADFKDYAAEYFRNWENWEKIGELPMRFNRLIILMAQCFHASTGIFGDTPENSRLTQHFEIYL